MTSTADLVTSKRIKLLVCPACQGDVRLVDGVYCSEGHETKALKDLAVKGEPR